MCKSKRIINANTFSHWGLESSLIYDNFPDKEGLPFDQYHEKMAMICGQ